MFEIQNVRLIFRKTVVPCIKPSAFIVCLSTALSFNPAFAVTLLGLCFFFNQLTEGSYWASSIAIGGQFAGSAGGVMNTGANVIGILNALLIPWIAGATSWTFAIASGAFFCFLGALLMLLVRPDRSIELD